MIADLAEQLEDRGIYVKVARGTQRGACPKCDHGPKDDALAVTIDEGGAVWKCHRCDFKGGINGKANGSAGPAEHHQTLADWGRAIWDRCEPIKPGTVATKYLEGRGCDLPQGDHLRWHPNLANKADTYTGPALVARVTDIETGEAINLHRTWLAKDGSGKAAIDHPRLVLKGHRTDGVVRLVPDADLRSHLVIGEGLETCLHAMKCGYAPAWAAISAGNLGKFPVLPWLTRLRVLVDHDRANPQNGKRAGADAARAVLRRYADTGDYDLQEHLRVIFPPTEGHDAADLDFEQMQAADMSAFDFLRLPTATKATLQIISPAEWQGQLVPTRRWHVKNWIPDRHVTALYGDGGTGKSLLAQQLITGTVIGRPWLDLETKKCRAIGFFCEDLEDELHIRQDDINRMYGCDYRDLADLQITSRVNLDNILMSFNRDGEAQATELFDELIRWAKDFGAEFAVIDTAADTFGGNENIRTQVRLFIQTCLGRLARAINGAVVLCAHPSRSGMSTGSGDGGSTGWSNSVRSRLYLSKPKPDGEAELDRDQRILEMPKANYGSAGDILRLRWLDGTLRVDPRVSGAMPGHVGNIERMRADQVFIELLNKAIAEGRHLSPNPNAGNYAPKLMARMEGRAGFTKIDFQRAMERLFAQGRIKVETYHRRGYQMIVSVIVPAAEQAV